MVLSTCSPKITQVDSGRRDKGSTMFNKNFINLTCCTTIKIPYSIIKEYLNHPLGLTLLTPGLVEIKNKLGIIGSFSDRSVPRQLKMGRNEECYAGSDVPKGNAC